MNVTYNGNKDKQRLLITEEDRESLLGLEWFSPLGLRIQGVYQIISQDAISHILEEFADVFKEDLGTYRGLLRECT
uniref:Uncharacterized protein n=1 Tax=Trichuris muris TaxID=70415 RepID=A0A5S6QNY4_TRIMR